MKMKSTVFFAFLVFLAISVKAQNFQNLNFESANIPNGTTGPLVPISEALPGWSAYFTSDGTTYPQTQVGYEAISTGGNDITLIDKDADAFAPLQGNYSVILFSGGSTPPYYSASISQSGLIPSGMTSLLMDAYLPNGASAMPIVAINGQAISMVPLQAFANYTVYGGIIPTADVGVSDTLSFTEPPTANGFGIFELDNISFSPNAVPEPSPFVLTGIGAIFFAFHQRFFPKRS